MAQPKIRTIASGIKAMSAYTTKPAPKTADSFYLSQDWRSFISTTVKQRGRRCEQCGRENTRIFGDHIHEIRDGGSALDAKNIMLLCGSCHSAKTAQARVKRLSIKY